MNKSTSTFSKTILASVIGFSIQAPSFADGASLRIDEVVVTATRRAQSVQDVPYNISAIGGEALQDAGINDMSELTQSIPGVSFVDRGVRGGAFSSGLAMRGISMEDGRLSVPLSTAPTVSTYVDETPLYANLHLSDIERVEVLRGPQGTIYGSGSLGGTLRFIHNKPSTEAFTAEVSSDVSQTKHGDGLNYGAELLLNIPLSETLALRTNLGHSDSAGWINSPNQFVQSGKDPAALSTPSDPLNSDAELVSKDGINSESISHGRLAVLWTPTDDFSAQFNYHKQQDTSDGSPVEAHDIDGYSDFQSPTRVDEPYESDLELMSLEMEYDLGFAVATTSVSHYDSEQTFSTDGTRTYTSFDFYADSYGSMPRAFFTDYNENKDSSNIVEIRLVSNTEGDIDWVTGIFYMDQETSVYNENFMPGYGDWADLCDAAGRSDCGLGTPLGAFNVLGLTPGTNPASATAVGYTASVDQNWVSDSRSKFKDQAVYGELTWHLSEAWQITGGLRYFDQTFSNEQLAGAIFVNSVTRSSQTYDANDTLFKFNTSYDLNDETMVYFTWSEGFRRGGANALPNTVTIFDADGVGTDAITSDTLFSYEPDRVTNTEIGIKGTLNARAQYTLAAYHIDWENVQLDTSVTPYQLPGVINAGTATSQGIELELNTSLSDQLQAILGYAYVDAELSNPDAAAMNEAGIDFDQVKNRKLPWSSEHTVSLTLQYHQMLSNDVAVLYGLRGNYRSSYDTQINPDRSTRTKGFDMWNAYMSVEREQWTLRASVDNLFNERGLINTESLLESGPNRGQIISAPRSLGLGITYHY